MNPQYKQIVKILDILGNSVYVNGKFTGVTPWNIFMFAREQKQFLNSATWQDYRADHPNLYPNPDIEKETTYDKCVDCEINLTDNKEVKLIITLYNGDTVTGVRKNQKCKFFLIFPHNVVGIDYSVLLHPVERRLRYVAEGQLQEEDEQQHEQRIKDRINQLLRTHQ